MNTFPSSQPLTRHLTLADLPGVFTKRLEVPPGYTGLAVDGKGRARTFAAGRHTAVGVGARLFRRASDWQFALLPAGTFALSIPIPRLLAGDGDWVDVMVLAAFSVADPARAAGVLAGAVDMAVGLSAGLEGPAQQAAAGWTADDASRPEVGARLTAMLRPPLEAQAGTLGLKLERVISVSTRRSDEAVESARKLAELEAALAQVEMEKRMAALTTEAEWHDFVRQLEADYALPPGALEAASLEEEAAAPSPAAPSRPAQLYRAVQRQMADVEAGLLARVQRLLGKRAAPPKPRLFYWWERTIPWLKAIGMLCGIIGLMALVFLSGKVLDRFQAAMVLFFTLPEALLALATAFWMEHKAALQRREAAVPVSWLDSLGRGDRQRMDRLVREQVARELAALRDKINDARTHAYREGRREEALRLKPVEDRADTLRTTAEAQGYGQAAYLTEAHITHQQLAAMLDYDEELLARAAAVGDLAEGMRQTVLAEGDVAEATARLETALSALDHQFQARARFIQG